jgi:alginate O-acetyltransferase complex protein AlgI
VLFCSERFLIFFAVIFLSYWALPWHRARVWLLVGASFYFYASWNKWLAGIICVSTALDYFLARGMEAMVSARWRRVLLLISLAANLGLLVYFKYANFFLNSLEEALHAVGETASLPVLRVILPIGISFYTFEAINYTVDVYRRRIPAERNLLHFMLFITFLQLGVQFLLMGLFKKLAIADRMALYSDPIFHNPGAYGSAAIWWGVFAYAVQIYCDFSGYTDMALGSAHMLGYKLARNFNLPYLSTNISEFWRRWHISLSSWLRDYLFIPLGGSRGLSCPACQKRRTYRNLMITMILGGLWHGAAWTFVAWGMLHGLFLVAHKWFQDFCQQRPGLDRLLRTPPGTMLRGLTTFLCVCLAWVFFRAPTFATAAEVLRRMFVRCHGLSPPIGLKSFYLLAGMVVICHLLVHFHLWRRLALRLPAPVMGFGYATLLILALMLAPDSGKAFIYFQF